MRFPVLALAPLLTGCLASGCSSTNVTELVHSLAQDPNAHCVMVATPYGSAMVARGTPSVSGTVESGKCNIVGADVTNVVVPTQNITVSPPK